MDNFRIAAAVTASRVGAIDSNLAGMVRCCKQAIDHGAKLICFPEMNVTGYTTRTEICRAAKPLEGDIRKRLTEMAQAHQLVILAGMAERDSNNRIFATHMVVTPEGDTLKYRKLHLSPPEKEALTAGDEIPIFRTHGVTFGIQLCYDAHFPELATQMALDGVDVIFIPHASPRVTPEKKFASWMRHLPARAYDNSIFIVACNPCGGNGLGLSFAGLAIAIDPSGSIIEGYLENREGLLVVDLKAADLEYVRSHRMRYFLPNRRSDLYRQ